MTTTKKRLNISLSPYLERAISLLAKKDNLPEATKITQILEQSIEQIEDDILLQIAEEREKDGQKPISYKKLRQECLK